MARRKSKSDSIEDRVVVLVGATFSGFLMGLGTAKFIVEKISTISSVEAYALIFAPLLFVVFGIPYTFWRD